MEVVSMSDKTGIEWTDATWNPIRGCSRVSQGCVNCYAERVAARFSGPGQPYEGLARMTASGPRWTGEVRFIEDAWLQPLRWKRPRRIFVNSMSDLFHEDLDVGDVARIFAVMARASQHTFQVLTKRPDRMLAFIAEFRTDVLDAWRRLPVRRTNLVGREPVPWPLPNVWLGVSAENQATADERIPLLLQTPAAVRFVSAEPLLGPIDFTRIGRDGPIDLSALEHIVGLGYNRPPLDWIIVGGESGPGARPMHPDWARSIRDQCQAAGVSFFFKQWGETVHIDQAPEDTVREIDAIVNLAGNPQRVYRVGKKHAGRELDGRTWDQFPV